MDGLHQTDLDRYVARHPASAFAAAVRAGTSYANAGTPIPSDSFPGTIAEVTGVHAATTGIYYDDVYDRSVLPPGMTTCTGGANR